MVSMLVAFRQKILSRCWSVSLHRHSCCGAYRAHTRLFLVFYWSVTDFLLSGCSDTPLPPVSSERGYGLPRPPTRLASVGSSSFLVLSPICYLEYCWTFRDRVHAVTQIAITFFAQSVIYASTVCLHYSTCIIQTCFVFF